MKQAYHTERWGFCQEFFSPGMGRPAVFVEEVDSPRLLKFVEWRREKNPRLTASSVRKDLVILRQIVKFAVARGVITTVPMFPGAHIVGSIDNNPQPWLDKQERDHLLAVANDRIDEASNVRIRGQRTELRDWMLFMWNTGLRVDEARALQVRDCTIKHANSAWEKAPMIAAVIAEGRSQRNDLIEVKRSRAQGERFIRVRKPVEVRLRSSKPGPRICQSRAYADAVLTRLTAGKKATDPLFTAQCQIGG